MPLSDSWPGDPRTDDASFCEYLADLSEAARTGDVTLRFAPHEDPVVTEPGAWNLAGDKAFALEYPLSWNYLDERSPNHHLKQLEKRLYLARLQRWWDAVPQGGRVLDLGGGIGRFACEWLRRGQAVTLADPNQRALVLALGHLARCPDRGRFELFHLAAESLTPMADETFEAITAMELFCYLSRPEEGMIEAARVLRKGGVLMCSVESATGAGQQGAQTRSVTGDTWVNYFTAESLAESLTTAGLVVETVFGTHYLADGPLHHLIDFDRLGEPEYDAALIELEGLLEQSTRYGQTGRAWVAVARKP